MKNSTFGIYAVPVALLLMAGGLAAPTASADTPRLQRPVSGEFAFDRNASAQKIYANLQRTAERLCVSQGVSHFYKRKHDAACVASVIESGVSQIGRADLDKLHNDARG